MFRGNGKPDGRAARTHAEDNRRYAWKERTYVVPRPSRKGIQWKASALRTLQRLHKSRISGRPVTIVVPALFNLMPAENLALGWLNEIEALGTIRKRIADASNVTGWDVFTFHTKHNLDSYYASTISAVRDTWLKEGSLKQNCVSETAKRYKEPYHYNDISARLVENLVFQSSLMDWVSTHAVEAPISYQVVGTGLLSALVWSGALSFENAVRVALDTGAQWHKSVVRIVSDELEREGREKSEDNLGWLYFDRVRQVLEGRSVLALGATLGKLPLMEAPSRPFWYSVTAADDPVRLETLHDIQWSLESLNFASWSPRLPRALPIDAADVKGWLVSPQHLSASTCRWSVRNYLLATPDSVLLFLDHIASLGGRVVPLPQSEKFPERIPLARAKVSTPDLNH
jgi:hypothetical protein